MRSLSEAHFLVFALMIIDSAMPAMQTSASNRHCLLMLRPLVRLKAERSFETSGASDRSSAVPDFMPVDR